MNQDTTCYGGRPRPRPRCVRCGPSFTMERGIAAPKYGSGFTGAVRQPASINRGPCLLLRNGRPSQQLLSSCCTTHGRVSLGMPGHVLSPSHCPLAWRIWVPSNTCFLGFIRVHNPTASASVQPLMHSSRRLYPPI